MKLLSAKQLKEADKSTIISQNISSWQLMERASSVIFEALKQDFDIFSTHFTIICGFGNNGGDGLALARMLFNAGSEVSVFLHQSDKYSVDNLINQEKLGGIPVTHFDLTSNLAFKVDTVIIDAIFGYGLNRFLSLEWDKIIRQINHSGCKIISVDMPSGLMANESTDNASPIVCANFVYTFHSPKLAFFMPENGNYVQDFKVLDIGLSDDAIRTKFHYLTPKEILPLIRRPNRFSHKGIFGHVLIIGGSYGQIGSVILAAKAALKSGCGLVSAYTPKCGYLPLQSAFQECMVSVDKSENEITAIKIEIEKYTAIGIGVGFGTSEKSVFAFEEFIEQTPKPIVIDADGLNIISKRKDLLKFVPENSILTPHPKELRRLIGAWENDFERLEKAKSFSHNSKLILIVKGANSAIIFPNGEVYFNSTGNWGMATAGSGDVLTGMITSLLAQGYSPDQAAKLGVFLHGLSADIAIQRIFPGSLIASDIIANISNAWLSFQRV